MSFLAPSLFDVDHEVLAAIRAVLDGHKYVSPTRRDKKDESGDQEVCSRTTLPAGRKSGTAKA